MNISVRSAPLTLPEKIGLGVIAVVALLAPVIFSNFFLSALLTQAIWLGLVALSLIFLSSYGGMVSLAQVAIFGISALVTANLSQAEGGLSVAIDPWLAAIIGIIIAVAISLVFGAIASRSEGIYFLMITLAFGVMVYYFFGQVTSLAGHGGVNNVAIPGIVGDRVNDPASFYYVSLAVAAACYFGLRYLGRTPFGLTLQGIRDEPTRMRALGYHVEVHRTLAFGVAGLVAALAGILFVWWGRRIGPGAVELNAVIDVLVVAVIGGLYRLHGAWVGALAFVLLDNYTRRWTPELGTVLGPERFNTLLGLIFLAIVLISPGGLVGAYESLRDRVRAYFSRRRGETQDGPEPAPAPDGASGAAAPADRPHGPVAAQADVTFQRSKAQTATPEIGGEE
ncbi:MAG TPA: branched-chain amino acid ABC transporter permease [Solirubrobacterales bacterium]|jgi:branched-chain amino acid transport system permease protein